MQFVIFRYYTSHDGFKNSKEYDSILIRLILLVTIYSESIGSNLFDKTFMYM